MKLRTLLLLCVPFLAASAFAAWFFFGAAEDKPTPLELEQARYRQLIADAAPKAVASDPAAETALAKLLLAAPPPVADAERARALLKKAADVGYVEAQYRLGRLYAEGIGVQQDYFRAAEWLKLAANVGHLPDAEFRLGEMYFRGKGVPQSYSDALDLYHRAAEQGHPVAQFLLGIMYGQGWGVRQDLVEAYKWLTLALANRAEVMAYEPDYDPRDARKVLIPQMTADQRARAERAAKAWTPRHHAVD